MEATYKPTDKPVLCLSCGKPLEDDCQAQDFVVPGLTGHRSFDTCGWCDFAYFAVRLINGDIKFQNQY